MISVKELKALTRAMHSLGIVSLKTPEIELIVQPKPQQVRRKRVLTSAEVAEPATSIKDGFGGYTEDEILTWSSAPIGGADAQDNT